MGFPLPDTGSVTEDTGVVGGNLVATGDANFKGGFDDSTGWVDADYTQGNLGTLDVDPDGTWVYTVDNSIAAIQDLDTGDTITEVFTVSTTIGFTTTVTVTINGQDEPPCFVRGTMIETPRGPRLIETLKIGDEVLTLDEGVQEIRWVGSKLVNLRDAQDFDSLRPVRILKDCFGPNVPSRDLLVSPMHRMLVTGPRALLYFGTGEVLCAAKMLVNNQTIVRDPAPEVEYFHILFDQHQVIRANDCATESFLPGTVGLSNFDREAQEEVFALFPELRALPESYGMAARRILKGYEASTVAAAFKPLSTFADRLTQAA